MILQTFLLTLYIKSFILLMFKMNSEPIANDYIFQVEPGACHIVNYYNLTRIHIFGIDVMTSKAKIGQEFLVLTVYFNSLVKTKKKSSIQKTISY